MSDLSWMFQQNPLTNVGQITTSPTGAASPDAIYEVVLTGTTGSKDVSGAVVQEHL